MRSGTARRRNNRSRAGTAVSESDAIIHPRPQLRRDRWVDLCGRWAFAFDDEDSGLNERWFDREDAFDLEIRVPYPPESELSGVGESGYHRVIWYRRSFRLDEELRRDRLFLHFGA